MKKISKKISCILVLLAILVSSFFMGFDSKASNPEFYLGYAQPSTSANEGYVTFLIRDNNSGAYQINTFFWYCSASASSAAESPCYGILQISSSSFTFRIGGVGSASSAYYCLSQVNELERCNIVMNSSSQAFTFDFGRWGKTVLAYKYAGNVGSISSSVVGDAYPFNVYFSEDGSAVLLQGILSCLLSMQNIDSSILTTLNNILSSVDGVENQLSQVVSWLNTLNANTTLIDSKLASLLDKADRLIEEQEDSNTWLQKIWTSIQRLFKGDNVEDDAKVDEFGDTTTQQSDKISDLQEQNKVEKVNPDSASSSVDSNIDAEEIGNFGTVLTVFTGDTHILQYILIVLSVALISYVLFGKR